MRPARLTAALLIASAVLSACGGNDITAPDRSSTGVTLNQSPSSCRGIFIAATGRCEADSGDGARASVHGGALVGGR